MDEVIDALAGLDTMFLDKESQRLLDEELDRKRKARRGAAWPAGPQTARSATLPDG